MIAFAAIPRGYNVSLTVSAAGIQDRRFVVPDTATYRVTE